MDQSSLDNKLVERNKSCLLSWRKLPAPNSSIPKGSCASQQCRCSDVGVELQTSFCKGYLCLKISVLFNVRLFSLLMQSGFFCRRPFLWIVVLMKDCVRVCGSRREMAAMDFLLSPLSLGCCFD